MRTIYRAVLLTALILGDFRVEGSKIKISGRLEAGIEPVLFARNLCSFKNNVHPLRP